MTTPITIIFLFLLAAFNASAQSTTCSTLQPVFELPLDATSTVYRSTVTKTSSIDCAGCTLVVSTFRAIITTPVSKRSPYSSPKLHSTNYSYRRCQHRQPPPPKLQQHLQPSSACQKHQPRQVVRQAPSLCPPQLAQLHHLCLR